MRQTALDYCRALEVGDCRQAAQLMDPEDLLEFWQSLVDMETALRRVGEVTAPQDIVGDTTEAESFRQLSPEELMVAFLRRTVTGTEEMETRVLTVDEVSPGRGLAVYSVAGFSNTMDLVHKNGRWYVKLRFGLKDLAYSYREKVAEFERRAALDKPASGLKPENLNQVTLVGFADSSGELRIQPRFSQAENFSEGLAAVKLISQWGYIDVTGKVVVKARFVLAHSFKEGVAWVVPSDSRDFRFGLIDKTGKRLLSPRFRAVDDFSEGVAAASEDEAWGYVDKTGRWVIEPRYTFAEPFREGLAEVGCEDGSCLYIDKNGEALGDEFI